MYTIINGQRLVSTKVDEKNEVITITLAGADEPTKITKDDELYGHYLKEYSELKANLLNPPAAPGVIVPGRPKILT